MRKIVVALMVMALVLAPAGPALAETTQGVTVTATPGYYDISNEPATFDFGTVLENVDKVTGADYFLITDNSTIAVDITVQCTTPWTHITGINDWTYGVPGTNTANLSASIDGTELYDVFIQTDYTQDLVTSHSGWRTPTNSDNIGWEMKLWAPTSIDHADVQEAEITLTVAPS